MKQIFILYFLNCDSFFILKPLFASNLFEFFYVAIKGGGAHGGQAQRFGVADLLGQVQIGYAFKVGRQLYSRRPIGAQLRRRDRGMGTHNENHSCRYIRARYTQVVDLKTVYHTPFCLSIPFLKKYRLWQILTQGRL